MAATVESTTQPAFTFRTPGAVLSLDKYIGVSGNHRYAVAPDGHRFLLTPATVTSAGPGGTAPPHFVIVTNWTQELERLVPTK